LSTVTQNLKLIKPELSDNGRQTIVDIATNMEILDKASDIYMDGAPTSGHWERNKKIYYINPSSGGYIGLVNIRAGEAAPNWSSIRAYSVGDRVQPTSNNGHYYTCIQSGNSSPFEPTWLVASGTTTEDTKNKTTWQPRFAYKHNDIVVPTILNDRFYVCTVAGTSGASEPNWSTTSGIATTDNGVVWMTYRIVKWQESGVSANFRPFGKIE